MVTLDTREQAEKLYVSGMKIKEIAEKLGINQNTVKQWKSRYWKNLYVKETKESDKDTKNDTKTAQEEVTEIQTVTIDDTGLTPRRKAFCREYVKDFCGTQAAIRAGYSEAAARSEASRLLTFANVKEYIQKLENEAAKASNLTAEFVIAGLMDVYARCMEAQQVTLLGHAVEVKYTFNAKEANRALELLGKAVGLFRDRVEMTGGNGGAIQVDLSKVSAEERKKRLETLLNKRGE